jgi:hypothetical protein
LETNKPLKALPKRGRSLSLFQIAGPACERTPDRIFARRTLQAELCNITVPWNCSWRLVLDLKKKIALKDLTLSPNEICSSRVIFKPTI